MAAAMKKRLQNCEVVPAEDHGCPSPNEQLESDRARSQAQRSDPRTCTADPIRGMASIDRHRPTCDERFM